MKYHVLAAGLLLATGPAYAQTETTEIQPAETQTTAGQQTGMPLSQILAGIEGQADFGSFDEVDWDDDGYWEVEYLKADGSKVEVWLDPATGQPQAGQ